MNKATSSEGKRSPAQGKSTTLRCFITQHADLLKILESVVLLMIVLFVVGAPQ